MILPNPIKLSVGISKHFISSGARRIWLHSLAICALKPVKSHLPSGTKWMYAFILDLE